MNWIPYKDEFPYKVEKIQGEGNKQEEPTTEHTDRSKWTGRILIEVMGRPGTKVHPCFSDIFDNIMMLQEPLIIGKDGKLIIVYSQGRENCFFWAVSDENITARLIGYGIQV